MCLRLPPKNRAKKDPDLKSCCAEVASSTKNYFVIIPGSDEAPKLLLPSPPGAGGAFCNDATPEAT